MSLVWPNYIKNKMVDFQKDITVFSESNLVGIAAGKEIEACILKLQEQQDTIRIVFASAPSQDAMLGYIAKSPHIKWHKIVAFNMDEYLGLPKDAPQLFSKYLENKLFSKVALKARFTINANSKIQEEIERYSQLINEAPIDIVCLGIGENGHIAFNDPPVAKFNDPETIKVVELDENCRSQQVNDACFDSIMQVPKKALTLTIPALLKGQNLFCVAVGAKKSNAVKNALTNPVSTSCPASILTTHANCKFYFDQEAYKDIANLRSDV